jgi:hypothetical protein
MAYYFAGRNEELAPALRATASRIVPVVEPHISLLMKM